MWTKAGHFLLISPTVSLYIFQFLTKWKPAFLHLTLSPSLPLSLLIRYIWNGRGSRKDKMNKKQRKSPNVNAVSYEVPVEPLRSTPNLTEPNRTELNWTCHKRIHFVAFGICRHLSRRCGAVWSFCVCAPFGLLIIIICIPFFYFQQNWNSINILLKHSQRQINSICT